MPCKPWRPSPPRHFTYILIYCSHYRPWKPGPHRLITYILMYCSHYRPWKPGPHRQITYILPEFDQVSESPLARVVNVVSIVRQTWSYLHWVPLTTNSVTTSTQLQRAIFFQGNEHFWLTSMLKKIRLQVLLQGSQSTWKTWKNESRVYTWKTWKYHGILKNLINIMEKWHETWKKLGVH